MDNDALLQYLDDRLPGFKEFFNRLTQIDAYFSKADVEAQQQCLELMLAGYPAAAIQVSYLLGQYKGRNEYLH